MATLLPARSDTDLVSGRAMRTATRWSVSIGDEAAVFSVSVFFAFCSGAGTAVAALTCSWIVLVLRPLFDPAAECESPMVARSVSDWAAGRRVATFARGIWLEFGTSSIAARVRAAGF